MPQFVTAWWRNAVPFEILDKILPLFAFSRLHFKNYRWSDPSPGSDASFLLRLVQVASVALNYANEVSHVPVRIGWKYLTFEHAQFPDKGPGTVSYPVQCTCLFRKKKTTLKGKSICSTLYVRTHHVPTILAAWTTLAEPKKNSGSHLVGTTLRPCRTS